MSEAWRSASLKKISLIAFKIYSLKHKTIPKILRASRIVVPSWLMNLALKLVLQKEKWPIDGVGGVLKLSVLIEAYLQPCYVYM